MEHNFEPPQPGFGTPIHLPNPFEQPIPLPDKPRPELGDGAIQGPRKTDEQDSREKDW